MRIHRDPTETVTARLLPNWKLQPFAPERIRRSSIDRRREDARGDSECVAEHVRKMSLVVESGRERHAYGAALAFLEQAAGRVGATARTGHQRRPGICAFRARLSRRNPFLPDIRRRRDAPSHAGGDRDGRGNRPASNARLIRRGARDLPTAWWRPARGTPSVERPCPSLRALFRTRPLHALVPRSRQRRAARTTPIVAIMPLSSCSRMWQWNTNRPSLGPSNLSITSTRAPGGNG